MEFVCKQLSEGYESLISADCESFGDLNEYANKYKLSIYLNNGKLQKSQRYGKEVFMTHRDGKLYAHENPGKLAKLPTGVDKIRGCKYKMRDILKMECDEDCDIDTDWNMIEKKFGVGINLWRKMSLGLNKNKIINLRRTKLKPAIHLHCDHLFHKMFLVTCPHLYFRGNKKLLKKL